MTPQSSGLDEEGRPFTHLEALLHSLEDYFHYGCSLPSARRPVDDGKLFLGQCKRHSFLLGRVQGRVIESEWGCGRSTIVSNQEYIVHRAA